MQPIYLTTEPTANASCMCLKLVLTSHKNICKIVKQKIAQKIQLTPQTTVCASKKSGFYFYSSTFLGSDESLELQNSGTEVKV